MQLNLPIAYKLASCQNILIAGTGGGFDILIGLPLYFALRQQGKNVHLANYTGCDLDVVQVASKSTILLDDIVIGTSGPVNYRVSYFPEGYLAEWMVKEYQEEITIWMLAKVGAAPLTQGYQVLTDHLNIDALLLVDSGMDSLMHGDEIGAGTPVEDSISLIAAYNTDVPTKLLACLGFGTEFEEGVCYYHALENIARLIKDGGFLGSCALTPEMSVFQEYERACRYIWEQPDHTKSHISTRIIPAVHGEFGNHHMYRDFARTPIFVNPLATLYWFFTLNTVIKHNLLVDVLKDTNTLLQASSLFRQFQKERQVRPRRELPY